MPLATAIKNLLGCGQAYYTRVGGKRADIGINASADRQFLQTHADGYGNNNLLALDECP